MRKLKDLILRLIVSPLVLGIILIKYNLHALNNARLFLIHGGEWITYAKDDRHQIKEIYDLVKEQNKK